MKEEFYINELTSEEKELYKKGVDNLDRGKYDCAEELFTKLLESAEEFPPVYNKLAVKYIYCEEIEKAQELLEKALEIDAKFAPAITNIGSIERKKGKLDKAKEYYEKAIVIDEEYGPAYNNLGVIYREEGKFGKSVKNLKKARKLGGFAINLRSDKSLNRGKGCLLFIVFIVLMVIIFYMWIA